MTLYRSATMRYAYLSHDRPELMFSSKELARHMQAPDEVDMKMLYRAVRFLIEHPRVVQRFERQVMPGGLVMYSDSDHAGCADSRKSTSCTIAMLGKHTLKTQSTTQKVVALSSAESEFYAVSKPALSVWVLHPYAKT